MASLRRGAPFLVCSVLAACGARTGLSEPPASIDAGSADSSRLAGDAAFGGVALSRRHICQWSRTELECWGANDLGQLGYTTDVVCTGNESRVPCSTAPRRVDGITSPIGVATGDGFTCALESGGRITCWGASPYDPPDGRAVITGIDGATAIVAGDEHACALSGEGDVWCWGANGDGQLGVSLPTGRRGAPVYSTQTPQQVRLPVRITQIAAASATTCALDAVGSVWCWGADQTLLPETTLGGSGDPAQFRPTPTIVAMPPASSIVVGSDHSCAIGRDGLVRCWGLDIDGASSGDMASAPLCPQAEGVPLPCRATPVVVPGLHATQIAPAFGATCALTIDHTVRCWGAGSYGLLGDGATTPQQAPRAVTGIASPQSLVAANLVACAYDARAALWCWGLSDTGQLETAARALVNEPMIIAP